MQTNNVETNKSPEVFTGKIEITSETLLPVHCTWKCPIPNCSGEMIYKPCGTEDGNLHVCRSCSFSTILKDDIYPKRSYKTLKELTTDESSKIATQLRQIQFQKKPITIAHSCHYI